jgi:two-component system sensor histidine kinase YesM
MGSVIKEEHETSRVIKLLAKSLRRALTWGDDFVPVSEEVTFSTEFMEIYKYRFPETFDYHVQVDPAAEEVRIPKMCIQPLVENACLHGIEPISGKGTVTVTIDVEGDVLSIVVHDNGKGIEPDHLHTLMVELENEEEGTGIGLGNVYRRLRFYYADSFQFTVSSKMDTGTRVCVKLPVQQIEKG